jgi:DNA-binding NtrC family response regulator
VLAESGDIGHAEFPQIAAQMGGVGAARGQIPAEAPAASPPADVLGHASASEAPLLLDDGAGLEHPLIPATPSAAAVPETNGVLNLLDAGGDVRPLEDIEAQAIRFALSHYRGQMSEAARRLGIGRSTLYRKLDIHGMMMTDDAAT